MWTAMVLCTCFLFGRFLLLSWIVAPAAGIALGAPVNMAQASCAPTCRLDLSNLRVGDGDKTFLTTGPVQARYRLWRTLFIGPYVEKLHAQGLTLNLANAPKGHIKFPKFRWFRKKFKEDIEDAEPFLVKDLLLEDSTILYQHDGSPLRLRLEHATVRLPELRYGSTGRLETQARIAELAVGPLAISSGTLTGHCEMVHDREMELQSSTFSFTARDLVGELGGQPLAGISMVLSGRVKTERGRGYREDLRVALQRGGQSLGTLTVAGYYTKDLNHFDVTVRLEAGAELANLAMAAWGLPALPEASLSLATRLRFPRPAVGSVSIACTARTAGETVLDLDLATRSPLPPVLQPARIRVTGERLAIGRLLALYKATRASEDDTGGEGKPVTVGNQPNDALPGAAAQLLSRLSLPPAVLDLDLRGVSYGDVRGDVTATARVQGRHATLSPCTVRLADGTVQGQAKMDWSQPVAVCAGELQANGVDLGQLSTAMMDTGDGRVSGRLDQLDVSFQTQGASSQDLLHALSGKATLGVADLQLEDLKSLRRTAHRYRLAGLRNLRFDQGKVVGRVEDGRFVVDTGKLTGTSGRIDVSGSVGLVNRRLALALDAGLGNELEKQFRHMPKYGYLASVLQSRDGYAYLPAPIPLRGTLSRPKFDIGRLLFGAASSSGVQGRVVPFLEKILKD